MDSSLQRVALYTRISTDETNQPYSLGAQRDRLLAHVTSQPGWQVVAEYEDRASGKSLERPALADARRALRLAHTTCCWCSGSTACRATSGSWRR